jgi:hypothetical protein
MRARVQRQPDPGVGVCVLTRRHAGRHCGMQAAGVQLRGAAAAAGQRDEEDLPCCVEDDDAAVNYS